MVATRTSSAVKLGRKRRAAALSTVVLAILLAGCAPAPSDGLSARELHDAAETLATDTAAKLDVDGWEFSGTGLTTLRCGNDKIYFTFNLSTHAPPDPDRTADARTVRDYWESLGYETVIKGNPETRRVYAKGDDIWALSFSTGPGRYFIAGTTRCAPGNREDFED